MVITPDGAQKLIKKLEEKKNTLNSEMNRQSTFVVAVSEGDIEELRPKFSFDNTVKDINEINEKILKIKHARNKFNVETLLPDIGLTIDQALIKMAILNREYSTYSSMGNKMEKERLSSVMRATADIEYRYTNYDIAKAAEIGNEMYNKIFEIQEKLNLVNSTYTFEVDVEV